METPQTPEQWMMRAADARMTALSLGAGASRQMLLRIADAYDDMAGYVRKLARYNSPSGRQSMMSCDTGSWLSSRCGTPVL